MHDEITICQKLTLMALTSGALSHLIFDENLGQDNALVLIQSWGFRFIASHEDYHRLHGYGNLDKELRDFLRDKTKPYSWHCLLRF